MTNYVLKFASDDPTLATKVLAAIAAMEGVVVSSFLTDNASDQPFGRTQIGRNPRLTTPDQLTNQAKFVYDLLADGQQWSISDMADQFSKRYPTVRQPASSVGTLIRTMYHRGFVKQANNRKYYREID